MDYPNVLYQNRKKNLLVYEGLSSSKDLPQLYLLNTFSVISIQMNVCGSSPTCLLSQTLLPRENIFHYHPSKS